MFCGIIIFEYQERKYQESPFTKCSNLNFSLPLNIKYSINLFFWSSSKKKRTKHKAEKINCILLLLHMNITPVKVNLFNNNEIDYLSTYRQDQTHCRPQLLEIGIITYVISWHHTWLTGYCLYKYRHGKIYIHSVSKIWLN